MRMASLSSNAVATIVKSLTVTPEVLDGIYKVISHYGSGYVDFVHCVLRLHSSFYCPITDPSSGVSDSEYHTLMPILQQFDPTIEASQILVADKMDLLYGTDYRSYCEYTKFKGGFYETVFDILAPESGHHYDDFFEDTYEKVIRALEYVISTIEQQIAIATHDPQLDDHLIICLLPRGDLLFFLLM